ncbi:phage portal protein [Synechococcus moorigangaii CMS01]|nr:phage portal protein [Synechococcus moorigangaii CMS01]
MLRQWFGLQRKSAGRLVALSLAPRPAWSPRDYAGLAREGYGRNAVANRCVRLIAEAAAAVPLRIEGKGRAADAVRTLLTQPNPDQTGVELMETFHGHLQVAGNAYLEIAEGYDGPSALFVLRPDRVRVMPGPKGWADAFEYRNGSDRRMIERDRASGKSPVLHLKLFHPSDDHYGLPPLEAAARAVDVHNAGGAWAKALLDNAARPSGALVVTSKDGSEARLTDQQYQRLKDELETLHSGPANAGRPLLLEGGLDWKPMGHSPAEMDFIAARREAAREIALAFGVPPMMLGLPGDNTYANYRDANLAFYRQTILPLARKTCASLNGWLAPWLGEGFHIRPDEDALPALSEERLARWQRIGGADFLSDGEKRALLGLKPATEMEDEDD